jgi:ABC-type amino acid transport substrate-binding protein/dienelactone hydrolase
MRRRLALAMVAMAVGTWTLAPSAQSRITTLTPGVITVAITGNATSLLDPEAWMNRYAERLVADLGMKAVWKVVPFDKSWELAGKDVVDLVATNLANFPDRQSPGGTFSAPVLYEQRALRISAADKAKYRTIADFNGRTVGAVTGMAAHRDLLKRAPAGVKVVAAGTFPELYAMFDKGALDAVAQAEYFTLDGRIIPSYGPELTLVDHHDLNPGQREESVFVVRDKSTGLLDAVNAFVKRTPFPLHVGPATGRPQAEARAPSDAVRVEMLDLVDASRGRSVPVALYSPTQPARQPRLAVLSHGYGAKNTEYSFIARDLAAHGYVVASVQHEVPGDGPLPSTGNPYQTRMPSWRRGMHNILFVIDAMKTSRPGLDTTHVLLVGHSHGGDTSMLLATEHPARIDAVISLDNRRMPWPRASQPKLFSIRSSDQRADDGVIPTPEEQARFGMRIVSLPATNHDDMWDGATEAQQAEILGHIGRFLDALR